MESISSVGLHCGRIGAMVVEVGAPEARALVARGAVSTNQLLGTQRTSKLTQSCLQNISKFSQFVSVSNAQLLGTQQTSKWRSNRLETGIKLQGTRADGKFGELLLRSETNPCWHNQARQNNFQKGWEVKSVLKGQNNVQLSFRMAS